MTASSSLCIQLGNAKSTDAGAFTTALTVASGAEIATIRQGQAPGSVDAVLFVVSDSDLSGEFSPMELANWIPCLKSNAAVAVQVVGEPSTDLQPVHTAFLLAGLSITSERRTVDGSRVLTSKREASATVSAAPLKKNAVTVSLDDADMIDEDGLLDDDVLAPPPAIGDRTAGDDCDGREPCDNCTCGRSDQGAPPKEEPAHAPSSSCGKCHLGDAFRCGSCPHLGKPAFKAGEEHLVLQLADDF